MHERLSQLSFCLARNGFIAMIELKMLLGGLCGTVALQYVPKPCVGGRMRGSSHVGAS